MEYVFWAKKEGPGSPGPRQNIRIKFVNKCCVISAVINRLSATEILYVCSWREMVERWKSEPCRRRSTADLCYKTATETTLLWCWKVRLQRRGGMWKTIVLLKQSQIATGGKKKDDLLAKSFLLFSLSTTRWGQKTFIFYFFMYLQFAWSN